MHVFVAGGTGHSGSYIIPELIAAGHEVTALARSDTAAAAVSGLGAKVRRGSLEDLDGLKEAAEDSDGVIHVAHRQDLFPSGGIDAVSAAELQVVRAYGEALAETGKPLVAAGSIGSSSFGTLGRAATEEDPALAVGEEHQGTLRARNVVELAVIGLAQQGVRSSIVRLPTIMHSTVDRAGFLPTLIALAKDKGFVGYPGNGANRWNAVHVRDAAAVFRLALEKAPAGTYWHAVSEGGLPFRVIAEAISSRLGLPSVSVPSDVLMLPGYFGFLANLVTLDLPVSNLITRRTLGWEPTQPGLLADLDNGHYFTSDTAADTPAGADDVATLEKFVTGDPRENLRMVDENAVWHEAATLPWAGQWRGPGGFARLVAEIDTVTEMTVRDYTILPAGEVVELRLNLVFTSRKSGRRLPMEVVEHYRVRAGKIYGATAFYKDTQAVNDLVKHG